MTAPIVGRTWRNHLSPTRTSWLANFMADGDWATTHKPPVLGQLWTRLDEVPR
jgi:hypothetical protein